MSRPDGPPPTPAPTRRIDWRGWLTLAWVVWFGLLYGRMVMEQRGGTLRSLLIPTASAGGGSVSSVAVSTPE